LMAAVKCFGVCVAARWEETTKKGRTLEIMCAPSIEILQPCIWVKKFGFFLEKTGKRGETKELD